MFADQYFNLKDSITSSLDFENSGKETALQQLQREQTNSAISKLDSKSIPLTLPRKLIVGAFLSGICAISLSFIPASQAVLDQQEKERQTLADTKELKAELNAEIDHLLSELTEREKAIIDPDQIKKWVNELKPTADERQAMLGKARIKQRVQKKIADLEKIDKKNQALLKAAGLKLQTSKNSKVMETGSAMSQKDFDAVAKALEEFKTKKDQEKQKESAKKKLEELIEKLKQQENLTEEERKKLMEEMKALIDELAELTKQMAEAADENDFDAEGEQTDEMMDEQLEEMLEKMGADGLPDDYPMDRLMELLNKHAQEMQDQMDGQMMDGEPMTLEELMEMLEMMEGMDEGLEELQEMMLDMEARKQLRMKLSRLRSKLRGHGAQQLGLAQKGGKKPGVGTDNSRRKEKDPKIDNDNFTKIKGQQGKGPVSKKTEAAASGTGTSNKKSTSQQRDYEHQMSSYLNRDDIPEDMKQAMRQYYKDVHELAPADEQKEK